MKMKWMVSTFFIGVLALAVFAGCSGGEQPEPPEPPRAETPITPVETAPPPEEAPSVPVEAADDSGTETVAEGNNSFALDLYDKLKEEEGNLFFSPYSISTALAMTYAGARANTEKQMAETLNFALDQQRLHPEFARLEAQLNILREKEGIELNVANALWADKDYEFLSEFLDLTNENYGAVTNRVDFKTAHETARKNINAWVEQKTNNKIKELIQEGVLNSLTRLVLTNAIYFKGYWANQFKEERTKDEPFWLAPGKSVAAPMMTQQERFKYMGTDSLKVLELPYVGDDLSMVVLLPKEIDGLSQLEDELSMEKLDEWLGRLGEREVLVTIPRFKMDSAFRLDKTLDSMGMPDAFSDAADFSGIDGTTALHISAIIHKAFVDVNEEGTEAAAATAVVVGFTSAMEPVSPPVFRADHPFVFLIRHNASGSILFLGRVVNPVE